MTNIMLKQQIKSPLFIYRFIQYNDWMMKTEISYLKSRRCHYSAEVSCVLCAVVRCGSVADSWR